MIVNILIKNKFLTELADKHIKNRLQHLEHRHCKRISEQQQKLINFNKTFIGMQFINNDTNKIKKSCIKVE